MPTPPREPSSAACGTLRWIQPPQSDINALKTPMSSMVANPRCQVIIPAAMASIQPRVICTKAGPRTQTMMPMVDGVSIPSGTAVTVCRFSLLASWKAIPV